MNSLLDLARRHTQGEASPRTHQASRARVLDRLQPKRSHAFKAILAVGLIVPTGALAFAGAKAVHVSQVPNPNVVLTAPPAAPTVSGQAELNAAPEEEHPTNIQVTPDNATIYWDDKKLDGNPSTLAPKVDNKVHRLRAEAPGYASKTQLVTMDSPHLELELELQEIPIGLGPVTSSASIIDADSVVESLRSPFQTCFVQALADAPTLGGHATVVLVINDRGKVDDVKVQDGSSLNAQVTTCLASTAVNGIQLRVAGGGTVRIPLTFRNKL